MARVSAPADFQGFQQIANQPRSKARIREGKDGTIVLGKTSRTGRAMSWLKTKLRPGSISNENRRVMQSFISEMNQHFDGATMAAVSDNLQADLRAGFKLTGAKITAYLDQAQQAIDTREARQELNEVIIDDYSNLKGELGQIIDRAAAAADFEPADRGALKMAVQDALLDATADHTRSVSARDAKAIASDIVNRRFTTELNQSMIRAFANSNGIPANQAPVTQLLEVVENHHIDRPQTVMVLFSLATSGQLAAETDLTPYLGVAEAFANLPDPISPLDDLLIDMNRCAAAFDAGSQSALGDDLEEMAQGELLSQLSEAYVTSALVNHDAAQSLYDQLTSQRSVDFVSAMNDANAGERPEMRQLTSDVIRNIASAAGARLGKSTAEFESDFNPGSNYLPWANAPEVALKNAGVLI